MTTEPLWQPAGQQLAYRRILEAMAYPGRVLALADAPRAVLATLLDAGVGLCDPHGLLDGDDLPLLGARHAAPEHADYLLADAARAPDFTPKLGSLADPEQSATVLLRVAALADGDFRLRLSGPGVAKVRELRVDGIHPDWLARRADWVCAFPLGVDFILADRHQIAALPRTTRVEVC